MWSVDRVNLLPQILWKLPNVTFLKVDVDELKVKRIHVTPVFYFIVKIYVEEMSWVSCVSPPKVNLRCSFLIDICMPFAVCCSGVGCAGNADLYFPERWGNCGEIYWCQLNETAVNCRKACYWDCMMHGWYMNIGVIRE